jgi:putative ABC transport system permease protein
VVAALKHLLARAAALFRKGDADRDFAEELQSHVELLTADNVARGMTPAAARRAAALKVGSPSSLVIQHRDARGLPWLEDLIQDLAFAGRLIARDRWFSAAAIVAIALGIGANTLGFTIINAAFFRGFAFDEADRLYAISWESGSLRRTSAVADLEDWRTQASTFQAIAGSSFGAVNISDDVAVPEQTQGSWVTANLFDVLRQAPLIGRTFLAGDAQPGAPPVVIIGHDLWQTRFNGDPAALGRTLRINGTPATIIGVMPAQMKFPGDSELWMLFVPTAAQLSRAERPLGVFGRLADGETRESAMAQMDAIERRIMADYPEETKNLSGIRLETLIERYLGSVVRSMFITIMGAVIFVLLIACANVASLLLSRSVYRSREIAVRFSMGATRGRIIRQLLVESTMLSMIGGLAGLILAAAGVRAFDAAIQATEAPYWLSFTIDYRVLGYVAAVCVATGVLFGMAPAWQLSNSNHLDTLKDGGRATAGGRRSTRFGAILVVGELTLTVVLLCGAGLMTRSFAVLYSAEPGFDLSGLYRMRMQLPPAKYPTPADRQRFFDQLAPRLSAIAGVSASAITTVVPPLDIERVVEIDGHPLTANGPRRFVGTAASTPSYFDMLGMPLVRGRYLDEGDGAPGRESVIINQRMADQFFTGQDPIGKRLRFAPEADSRVLPTEGWRTVVGVTGNILQGSPQDGFRNAMVYLPLRQESPRTTSIMVRSTVAPNAVMAEVRRAVQSIDGDQPVFAIQSVAAVFAGERIIYEIFATLFSVLALIAVTLSAVGIYGVLAYAVTQRMQEIGVRMAIGARKWQVSWLFLKRGLTQLLCALALGVPMALGLATVVRFRLVDIEPTDPVTIIGTIVIVVTVVLAACIIPVRKAARVDPVIALRLE